MRYKFTKEQAEEIETMRKKNRSAQKEKRLWVLSLRARGMKQREIEELTGVSHSHVCALIRKACVPAYPVIIFGSIAMPTERYSHLQGNHSS